MKKKFMIVAMILLVCFSLVACGKNSESPYVGTWKGVKVGYGGVEMSIEELFGAEIIIELKDDGTCSVDFAGDKGSGNWTETEDGFSIEGEMDFKVEGNTGTADYDGATLTIEKQ
ncbi:hypothetical protein [Anaerofustis butyriciformans]|uniref:hypothetical protein n=1 Tax=Anaerofustis TaxID=264995 RepID=UPI003F8A3A38